MKKSKTETTMDFFNSPGIMKGQQLFFLEDIHIGQPKFHLVKARQPGKTESMMFYDEWGHFHSIDNIMSFELRIEKNKAYNGYTVWYYNKYGRKIDLCNNDTYNIADMNKTDFLEHAKKEFNAVPKNHHKIFFRTEEDAQNMVDWIDAIKLAHKMKKELA